MRVKHDARAGVALLRDDGAEAVVRDVVRERLEAVGHDFAHGFFVAGRAGRFGEFFEELDEAILGGRLRRGRRLGAEGKGGE